MVNIYKTVKIVTVLICLNVQKATVFLIGISVMEDGTVGMEKINCTSYSCFNMFRCKLAVTCIHTRNVCDRTVDCTLKDDETLCEEIYCIDKCKCLNYAMNCQQQHFINANNLFSFLKYFAFIHIVESAIQNDKINKLTHVILFIA